MEQITKNIFNRKVIFILLLLILATEFLLALMFSGKDVLCMSLCSCCHLLWSIEIGYLILALLAIALMVMLLIGWIMGQFKLSPINIGRLITNSFSLNPLSIAFTLLYILHISWLADSVYNVVFSSNNDFWNIPMIVFAILTMLFIQPQRIDLAKKVDDCERTLLVSGMSWISQLLDEPNPKFKDSFEGFLAPFYRYKHLNRLVIVTTKEAISTISKRIPNINEKDFEMCKTSLISYINDKLKEIPSYENRSVEVIISQCVDYNKFDECFYELGNVLRRYEYNNIANTKHTVINTSPGTATISSAIAIYAIRGARLMTYNDQGQNIPIEKMNMPVETDVTSLKDVMNDLFRELELVGN